MGVHAYSLYIALLGVTALTSPASAAGGTQAFRFAENPIVVSKASKTLGDNINGPSLIRTPEWVAHPLGRYYLYFAHHRGKFIRLLYSDELRGPWHVYEPGTLAIAQAPQCHDHIASPDVHVDDARHEIRMYFHCPAGGVDSIDIGEQKTFVATSTDGLQFTSLPQPLGPAYFRVFQHGDYFYAIVRGGSVLRSRDPHAAFEQGPVLVKADRGRILRHAAVDVRKDELRIYYSRIGDEPERILVTNVRLTPDWHEWSASEPTEVLGPERSFEGGDLPLGVSQPDDAPGPVRQLRDPCIYREGKHMYLVYSIAGESGLAIAELETR
jgi:hypothetical protein